MNKMIFLVKHSEFFSISALRVLLLGRETFPIRLEFYGVSVSTQLRREPLNCDDSWFLGYSKFMSRTIFNSACMKFG